MHGHSTFIIITKIDHQNDVQLVSIIYQDRQRPIPESNNIWDAKKNKMPNSYTQTYKFIQHYSGTLFQLYILVM